MDADPSSALAYSHGAGRTPLLGRTIGDDLRAAVGRHGDRDALVFCAENYRATYRQFWDAVTHPLHPLLHPLQSGGRNGRGVFTAPAVNAVTPG